MLGHITPRRAVAIVFLFLGAGLMAKACYIPAKAWLAEGLIAKAWSETLIDGDAHRPWSWADHWPVGRLVFPEQGQDQIVIHGAQGASLAFAPGAVSGFAIPGDPGISIVGGHRDTHFSFLEHAKPGEKFKLQTRSGDWQNYEIEALDIVDSRTAVIKSDVEGASKLLLVTCYPFNAVLPGGPLRYIVTARKVERVSPLAAFRVD